LADVEGIDVNFEGLRGGGEGYFLVFYLSMGLEIFDDLLGELEIVGGLDVGLDGTSLDPGNVEKVFDQVAKVF
jgi:hypothetical protein